MKLMFTILISLFLMACSRPDTMPSRVDSDINPERQEQPDVAPYNEHQILEEHDTQMQQNDFYESPTRDE